MVSEHLLISEGPEATAAAGRALGRCLQAGDIVGLHGDLGAGKTQFARGVSEGLAADPRFPVCSPTFTLINEHPGRLTLYHIDLYRLTGIDEMLEIGLFDLLDSESPGVCLVEWMERLGDELPAQRLDLAFQIVGDDRRELRVEAFGSRAAALLACWRAALVGGGQPLTSS